MPSILTSSTEPNTTEQSAFWQGEFGDAYTERNAIHASERVPFFQTIVDLTPNLQTVCELGANKGHNLVALQTIKNTIQPTGVEINASAAAQLQALEGVTGIEADILADEFTVNDVYDLVMTCGVMIHLNPEKLPLVYERMRALSKEYILINEYFNPSPVEISYRGHSERLFKRDFAGEFMDAAEAAGEKFNIVATGFLWKRDNPAWDDTTWFLLKRA